MFPIRLTLLLATLLLGTPPLRAQPQDTTFTLAVPVDEVDLTFHATDTHNLAVNDLKLNELNLRDNGNLPDKILAFQSMQDLPIRAGILMDTSASMAPHLPANRAIALQYAQSVLRQQTDQAFITDFGHLARLLQPWTSDKTALTRAIGWISTGSESRVAGTAIFDTLYRTCHTQFGSINHATSGNFILLFSDGEDNASFMRLSQAVNACQHANTAIYAFRSEEPSTFGSSGPQTLAQLAEQTGGRVFAANGSAGDILDDLQLIEGDLRSQYHLIFKPAQLKHDGAFHRITLEAPNRFLTINVRSGYYAPAH
jgi:Ca-activated chloride channel family protein